VAAGSAAVVDLAVSAEVAGSVAAALADPGDDHGTNDTR
jgi:hypothetical protein